MRKTLVVISAALALHESAAKPTKVLLEKPEAFQVVQQILYDAENFVARRHPLEEADEFEAEVELFPLPYKVSEAVSTILVYNPYAEKVTDILSSSEAGEQYFEANWQACKELELDIFILKTALAREYPFLDSERQYSQRTWYCLRLAFLQFEHGKKVTGIMDAETCTVAHDRLPEFFVAHIKEKEVKTASTISVSKRKKKK